MILFYTSKTQFIIYDTGSTDPTSKIIPIRKIIETIKMSCKKQSSKYVTRSLCMRNYKPKYQVGPQVWNTHVFVLLKVERF